MVCYRVTIVVIDYIMLPLILDVPLPTNSAWAGASQAELAYLQVYVPELLIRVIKM